jgi:hypothetical protein
VERLRVDLIDALDLDEAHRGPCHGFGDGLGIQRVVLVGFDIRLHELRRDDPDRVAERLQFARQPLRAGTGLHPDQCWSRVGEEREERITAELDPLDRLAG